MDELAHDSADDFHFGFTSGTKSRSEVAQRCVVFDGYLKQACREPCAGSDCPLCLCLCCDALRCRFLRAVEPTPHRINDDPKNHSKYHWFGTIGVAPNGRIDSVWMDTRNAANNTDSQLFYSYSTDGGVTWSPNVAVSQSFTPLAGWPNQNKIGDYITIVSDNTGGDVVYSATYNFNPSRDNTNKTSITSVYRQAVSLRQRLLLGKLLQRQLRPRQHQQLRPVPDRHRHQELKRLRELGPHRRGDPDFR